MISIYLAGDSTMSIKNDDARPESGWGEYFYNYLTSNVKIINKAKNGRSTKSFIIEGLLNEIDSTINNGDYLFIQFGHNDAKNDIERFTDPFTTYKDNLKIFINVAKSHTANPILLTPIYRRHFNDCGIIEENIHLDYQVAMKEVAKELDIPLIDTTLLTYNWLKLIGDNKSKIYFNHLNKGEHINYPEGKMDNTHLNEIGADFIARMIAKEFKKINDDTKKLVKI